MLATSSSEASFISSVSVNVMIRERKENAEKELKAMVEEECLKLCTGGYGELPSPEILEEKIIKPIEMGKQPDSAFIEGIRANMEMHVTRAQKCLSMEGTLKREFAKDFNAKYGALINSFMQAHTFYLPITEYLFSQKWGVCPNTGSNATFGRSNASKPEEVKVFFEGYKGLYEAYRIARDKFDAGNNK